MVGERSSNERAPEEVSAIGVESVRGLADRWMSESPDGALVEELSTLLDSEGVLGFLALAGALTQHELHGMGHDEGMFQTYFEKLDAARSMRPDPRCEWFASRPLQEQQLWERYAVVLVEMLAMDLEDVAASYRVKSARWTRVMTTRDDLGGILEMFEAGEVGATLAGALHVIDVRGERLIRERPLWSSRPGVRLSRAVERNPNRWWTASATSMNLTSRG